MYLFGLAIRLRRLANVGFVISCLFVLVVKVPQRSQAFCGALDFPTRGSKLPQAVPNSRPLNVMFAGCWRSFAYLLAQSWCLLVEECSMHAQTTLYGCLVKHCPSLTRKRM